MKYLILLSTLFFSCKGERSILIEGVVSNIPTKMLYLSKGGRYKKILDSTTYKDGKFLFRLKDKTEPFEAQIMYFDVEKRPITLTFKNHISGKGGIGSFWLDYGKTSISGAWKINATFFYRPYLDIIAGKDNEYFFRYAATSFGQNFNSIRAELKKEPNSYFLLSTVLDHVQEYSPTELDELINAFSAPLQKSEMGKRVYTYIDYRYEKGKPFKKIQVSSMDGKETENIHKNKLNMIIFWASWCFPCRQEIPQLKEIYAKNKFKDFSQTSVSIDEDRMDWMKALKQEKMDWKQYIVKSDDKKKILAIYDFQAIPLIVFTDKNGMEIKRFEGYDVKHLPDYQNLIDSQLH